MNISIDFETYSECDIKTAGAYAYADHPTTEVLCLAWAVNDDPPELWTPDKPVPQRLLALIEAGGATLWAWNSFFEMAIWNLVLKWKPVPIEQWRDTAALAAAHAYPRSLAKCGEFLGLSDDLAKSKRGWALIRRLCRPLAGDGGGRETDPALYQELYDYCIQDVIAEREIRHRLRHLRGIENQIWEVDQRINWRGVQLDRESVENALVIIDSHSENMNKRVVTLTNGFIDTTGSRARAMTWCASQNYPIASYDKAAINAALQDDKCPENVKEFLGIRQSLSRSSTKKYQTMLDCIGQDGRVHGSLMYHGASTGRWSGRHINAQNLPRPTIADVDACIAQIRSQDPDKIDGEPMECLASCLRSMLTASDGNRLIVSDYASIEARALAWLADHEDVLQTFRSGKDIYKATASSLFQTPYDRINSDQRFVGKVATLALGYQGGVRAFQKMSEAYGTEVTEDQALKIRNDWRDANSAIVKLWVDTEKAAKNAISYAGKAFTAAKGTFRMVAGDLLFKLPSSRIISFPKAQLRQGNSSNEIIYEGMNNLTHRWGEIKGYGGTLVQSINQAVARDILAEAILRCEAAKYPVVLHVHDEIVADVPKGHGSLAEFEKLMCVLPQWAEGMPVEAEGYESNRYRK